MTTPKSLFESRFPSAQYLGVDHLQALKPLLLELGFLEADEAIVATEKPGEGNMNFVLRVTTDRRSFIVKQSRPWVEKYPTIEAPAGRVEAEASYYRLISKIPDLQRFSPALLRFDAAHLLIVLEDLGASSDFSFLYRSSGETFAADESGDLLRYLSRLHHTFPAAAARSFPTNLPLRQLNHEHIFNYPFQPDNGFDLDAIQPGLAALAEPLQRHQDLKAEITRLGDVYLSPGTVLIHGDFYPGSWLRTATGTKVIDPEFAHWGRAEFDVGVMAAHLVMAGRDLDAVGESLRHYQKPQQFDSCLSSGFCGVEILRRLLGVAQLPLELDLTAKRGLIDLAVKLIEAPQSHELF